MNKILVTMMVLSQTTIIILLAINRQSVVETFEFDKYQIQRISNISPRTKHLVTNIRIIDGDTVEGDINLPLNIILTKMMIRFDDFDAWESNRRRRTVVVTDQEIILGKSATKFLVELLENSELLIELDGNDRDMYGRILATPIINSSNNEIKLKELMKENDFIRDDRFIK